MRILSQYKITFYNGNMTAQNIKNTVITWYCGNENNWNISKNEKED